MGTVSMVNFGGPRRLLRAEEKDAAPVNWRRGMFRIWVLFCVAWVMGWTIELLMFGLRGGFHTTGELLEVPVLLFGPPIAMLLFGLAAAWAVRGFKMDNSKMDNSPPGE
mgnify:FL=1|jgi:hypothetical protein